MAHLFDQPNTNETIKWKGDSDVRGSFSILSTCVITLLLGVYSAVHLNLPGNPRSLTEAFLRRMAWVVLSLFAPEVLVLVAWSQLQAAKRVHVKVHEVFDQTSPSQNAVENAVEDSRPRLKNAWTMTHSFCVVMGGFAIDVNGVEPFIPSQLPTKLTEKGFDLLLRMEPKLVPDISADDLKDKSKGDWLTKSLACIQATWFCISCLVRVGQQLPLSLLELNTFAHAVCTIVVYFVWWNKPLDVERPVLIDSERIRPLVAFMWMSSKTSARPKIKDSGSTTYEVGRDPEFEAISFSSRLPMATAVSLFTSGCSEDTSKRVTTEQGLPGTCFVANQLSTRWVVKSWTTTGSDENAQVYSDTTHKPAEFRLSTIDARRWIFAQQALDTYRLKKPVTDLDLVTIKPVSDFLNMESAGDEDWPTRAKHPWAALGFSVLSACYGVLHALGWNAKFPSRGQRILWRVSSLLIASPAGGWLLVQLVALMMRLIISVKSHTTNQSPMNAHASHAAQLVREPDSACSGDAKKFMTAVEGIAKTVLFLFCCLHLPARTYLVGESFRMAFFLPPNAFRATNWEKYFPHFG